AARHHGPGRAVPRRRGGALLRGQRVHAVRAGPGPLRRHRHREHLRRHPQRPGRGGGGVHRRAAVGQPGRAGTAGPVRAHPRVGPRRRREGHRQPHRHHPVGGHAAAPRPGPGAGGPGRGRGGGPGAGPGPVDGRHRCARRPPCRHRRRGRCGGRRGGAAAGGNGAGREGGCGGMSGAQALVAQLQAEGVDVVFGIPGGAVLPLYDALYGAPLRHVLVRHEQAAALAADGYARVTGRPGVCIATSGPGAMNLVTGLATSYMDSVPVVAITGNVATAVMGTDAFQEADTFGTTMPVTKHNYLVKDPADLLPVLAEAFEVARSGRPGPVLVDIPTDVFLAPVGDSLAEAAGNRRPWARNGRAPAPCEATVAAAARAIAGARQPVLYAGGGVITAGAADVLRSLVEQAGIPVTTTLMALGSVPVDHPLFLGMPGMHGTYAANMALTETDCLIAVGARFDDRVTGRLAEFAPQAAVIHVDIDAAEHGKIRAPQFPIVADARDGLEALLKALD